MWKASLWTGKKLGWYSLNLQNFILKDLSYQKFKSGMRGFNLDRRWIFSNYISIEGKWGVVFIEWIRYNKSGIFARNSIVKAKILNRSKFNPFSWATIVFKNINCIIFYFILTFDDFVIIFCIMHSAITIESEFPISF